VNSLDRLCEVLLSTSASQALRLILDTPDLLVGEQTRLAQNRLDAVACVLGYVSSTTVLGESVERRQVFASHKPPQRVVRCGRVSCDGAPDLNGLVAGEPPKDVGRRAGVRGDGLANRCVPVGSEPFDEFS